MNREPDNTLDETLGDASLIIQLDNGEMVGPFLDQSFVAEYLEEQGIPIAAVIKLEAPLGAKEGSRVQIFVGLPDHPDREVPVYRPVPVDMAFILSRMLGGSGCSVRWEIVTGQKQ